MQKDFIFDGELIKKYDIAGPRYTSYPTAPNFNSEFNYNDYAKALKTSGINNTDLSLYIHIPFCSKICFYCGCNKIATKNTQLCEPYLEHLKTEMQLVQQQLNNTTQKVRQLHWGGGTPTFLNLEQMQRLMAYTAEHFNLLDDDSGDYSIEIDPRECDLQTLQTLRKIGFNRLSFGVQDFNEKVQKAINRVQPKQVLIEQFEAAKNLGFKSINFDLIYGLPLQNQTSFSQTLAEVADIGPDRISVFNYAHLPERFKPQRRINEADLPSPAEKLTIFQNSIDFLTQNGYVYVGMDHFAKTSDSLAIAQQNRELHRNFQGYTIFGECDLIGLGVSSIGKVANTYIQNHHKLEDYDNNLEDGQFSTQRGLKMNEDDLIRQSVIQELICHFSLKFEHINAEHKIDFKQYFAKELASFDLQIKDELIAIDDFGIRILPKGRILVRSLCMVFDKYLDQNSMQVKFSRIV